MADTTRKTGSRRLARERIEILFARAAEFYPENPVWSNRCVELARKIGMRHRIRIDRHLRRQFCRRCNAYLVPGLIRVIQSAGRGFRRPEDRGVVLLVDDRFADERYQELLPPDWFMPGRPFSNPDYREALVKFWDE